MPFDISIHSETNSKIAKEETLEIRFSDADVLDRQDLRIYPRSVAKMVTTSRGAETPHNLLLASPGLTVLNTHIFLEHFQDGTR